MMIQKIKTQGVVWVPSSRLMWKKSDLKNDIDFSKKKLEDKFGIEIENFCYPFGKVNKLVYDVVKNKFKRLSFSSFD